MPLSRKIAYVDLSTGEIDIKPIPLAIRKKYLGGRGLDMYILYNHIKPGIDALGPENVICISAGILVATPSSASGRTHVAAKSPLTNFIGSTNMGGFFAAEMRFAGIDHLVVTGKSEKPVYIWIHDGEIEIRDATKLWGQGAQQTQQLVKDELNDREIQVLTIGQAGENLVRYANVMTLLKNAGGRTGMGAVMGSKNLKCVAARGTMDVKIAHPEQALEYNKKIVKEITSAKVSVTQGKLGTPMIWGATNSWGGVRTRNFRSNQFEYSDAIEPEAIDEHIIGWAGCFGCQVHCRGRYKIPSGPYKGVYGEGPEYTAQGAFCGEPGCDSMEALLTGNHLVNDYGMDVLEVGSMIAWAMELYEEGILTLEDTDGMDLKFGNEKALIEMVHKIAFREGLGDILAEGPLRAAQRVGKDSEKYLIHVKGMSNLHSDERATPGLALNIAVSSRGSDHLRGRPAIDLYGLPESVLREVYSQPVKYDGPLTSHWGDYEGKPWMVRWQETCYAAVDCTGICKYHTIFLGPNFPNFEEWSKLLYLNCDLEMTPKEIWDVGERCYNIERLFNIREGLTRKLDHLADRYYDEPTKGGVPAARERTIDRDKFEKMLDEYYEYHGWDKNGVPTKATLKSLGLDNEPTHTL
ncbi:MAG: aldehyde ferredoxin oxidoreductase family protein [Chloroflexi bacterium]|jgi:aldehyde:ferredoxin oxidoreductase|nr:aldehyde ferredoxin oxidoreductase family protein [Chloroflexota bacterium]MBT7290463.1 aldehyde ferredoxin oxidoreductase family protein [Chloroflexota bacterium]